MLNGERRWLWLYGIGIGTHFTYGRWLAESIIFSSFLFPLVSSVGSSRVGLETDLAVDGKLLRNGYRV